MQKITLFVLLAFSFICAGESFAAEIIIYKEKRRLEYKSTSISRVFRIALGAQPVGKKRQEGDKKTPEGTYFITHKNPNSQYYLSLGISYPNAADAKAGFNAKLISAAQYAKIKESIANKELPPQKTRLGGEIFIHGRGAKTDWTWGCVALDDENMQFLFNIVEVGDTVRILK